MKAFYCSLVKPFVALVAVLGKLPDLKAITYVYVKSQKDM